MANSPKVEIIGLDVGQRHVGVARASSIAKLAEPLTTLPTSQVFDSLEKIINQRNVSMAVVGLPRGLDGQDTAQTAWTRQWVEQAKRRFNPPLFWQDEALTSQAHKQKDNHAQAATRILQDFLDSPESDRVGC